MVIYGVKKTMNYFKIKKVFQLVIYTTTLAILIVGSYQYEPIYASWFQTISGDVHSDRSIDMNLPGSMSEYLSIEDVSSGLIVGDSGVITHDDGSPEVSLGSETPAVGGDAGTDWVVQSGAFPRDGNKYSYEYYNARFTNKTNLNAAPNLVQGSCSQGPPSAPEGVYEKSGDLRIDCPDDLTLPSGRYVFLIEDDLIIESRIKLASDSDFVAFIAGGDIIIRDTADGGSLLDPDIQGIYIANNQIDIRDDSEPLFLEGIFIGWDSAGTGRGFRLRREGGPDEVMEVFIFRPELLLYLPPEMMERNSNWEETAP